MARILKQECITQRHIYLSSMKIKIRYINSNCDGTAKSILAGCFKFGAATLLRGGADQHDIGNDRV